MFLLFMVCLMKIINMTTINKRNSYFYQNDNNNNNNMKNIHNNHNFIDLSSSIKENIKMNNNYLNFNLQQRKGTKFVRGMTEHPTLNTKTAAATTIPLKENNFLKLSEFLNNNNNNNIIQNDESLKCVFNNNNNNNNNSSSYYNDEQNADNDNVNKYLTEEKLKKNVQIVLNNIKKNYYKLLINNIKNNNNNNQHLINKNNNIKMSSPESDCNSNNKMGGLSTLACSIASSQDFTHDNSDYQWFLDYGYRDGVTHQSILSSLSASYNGIGELSYYEDLAKNYDANLAEIDIESFRTEDIHSLLQQIPSLCNNTNNLDKQQLNNSENNLYDNHYEQQLEQIHLQQQQQQQQQQQHPQHINLNNKLQNNDYDNSLYKSELLFSPIKESHISIDSLDLDGYPDNSDDIILTCKANKDNYTIAFEGSTIYSDESYYDLSEAGKLRLNTTFNITNKLDDIVKRKILEVTMSKSDTGLTTWSKLKKNNSLHRYPSGNNNSSKYMNDNNIFINTRLSGCSNNSTSINLIKHHLPNCKLRKSLSLPNLYKMNNNDNKNNNKELQLHLQLNKQNQLNVSQAVNNTININKFNEYTTNILPMYKIPITLNADEYNQQLNISQSELNEQQHINLQIQQEQLSNQQQPSFNLVKLFIKQKSNSTDTCMDVSSGCWPSDSSSSAENKLRKKSMNDSGKCSALSRNNDDELEDDEEDVDNNDNDNNNEHLNDENYDSLDMIENKKKLKKINYLKTGIKNIVNNNNINNNNNIINNNNNNINNNDNKSATENLNIKNNNKSLTDTSLTSDNITQYYNNNKNLNINHKMKLPVDMITKSIQTSLLYNCNNNNNSNHHHNTEHPNGNSSTLNNNINIIPISFLNKLYNDNNKKSSPVYVIYPNYTLPNLDFINIQKNNFILKPYNPIDSGNIINNNNINTSHKSKNNKNNINIDSIKHNINNNIIDIKSLIQLLPMDYINIIKTIPDINLNINDESIINNNNLCNKKPLFLLNNLNFNNDNVANNNNKQQICDCYNYIISAATTTTTEANYKNNTKLSQQKSSGYRSLSTINSSSINNDDLNISININDQRPPSGLNSNCNIITTGSPGQITTININNTINNNKMNMIKKKLNKIKRNSMFITQTATTPDKQLNQHQQQQQNDIKEKLLKRRSLQDTETKNKYMDNDYLYNNNKLPNRHYYGDYRDTIHNFNNDDNNETTLNTTFDCTIDNDLLLLNDNNIENKSINILNHLYKLNNPNDNTINITNDIHLDNDTLLYNDNINDHIKLKNHVSFTLFNNNNITNKHQQQLQQHKKIRKPIVTTPENGSSDKLTTGLLSVQKNNQIRQPWSTPPNSPNVSIKIQQQHPHQPPQHLHLHNHHNQQQLNDNELITDNKLDTNRFKRLQIQWELLSKDGTTSLLDESDLNLLNNCTKNVPTPNISTTPTATTTPAMIPNGIANGGNVTPTGGCLPKSKIPRPVSYPTSKTQSDSDVKNLRSPSRLLAPKKYTTAVTTPLPVQPPSRTTTTTPYKLLHNTPKKTIPTPRPATRTR